MVRIKKEGVILKATGLKFENQAVLNPACIKVGNNVHMFYRAVREGNHSSIGYCKLKGPLKVVERLKFPLLSPEISYEKHGVEDPRISLIDGKYYMIYMGYDRKEVVGAYAVSDDLNKFEKKGVIFPCTLSYSEISEMFKKLKMPKDYFNYELYDWSDRDTANTVHVWGKDMMLFPKKINGKFAMLHRVLPNIHLIYFKDFKDLTPSFWRKHFMNLKDSLVLDNRYWYESRAIGAGAPPVETKKGWLLIYHAIENSPKGRIYRASAALLDKKNPCKVIGRLEEPLFSPGEKWEIHGDVRNVVFPTGTAVFGDRLYIYYGAADKRIAAVSVKLNNIIDEMKAN